MNVAYALPGQVVVSHGHGVLSYLEVRTNEIVPVATAQLGHDVACVTLLPPKHGEKESLCAVGLWGEFSVRLLQCPSMKELCRDNFGGSMEVVSRSLQFLSTEKATFLLATLGKTRNGCFWFIY
jgi:hypothetical protein